MPVESEACILFSDFTSLSNEIKDKKPKIIYKNDAILMSLDSERS